MKDQGHVPGPHRYRYQNPDFQAVFHMSTRENRPPVFEPSNVPVSQLSPTESDGLDRMMAAAAQRFSVITLAENWRGARGYGVQQSDDAGVADLANPTSAGLPPASGLLTEGELWWLNKEQQQNPIGIEQWLRGRSGHGAGDGPVTTESVKSSPRSKSSCPLTEDLVADWCDVVAFLDEGKLAYVGAWLDASS